MSDYSPNTKRVIVEHRGSDPIATRAEKRLHAERHQDNWTTWMRLLQGGVIVCKSYGMAVNIRQSMYSTRKLVRERDGVTAWDHLTIRLDVENRDNRLTVEAKDTGILEIIPNALDPADYAAPSPSGDRYIIPDQGNTQVPTTLHPYEGDGRPPIDLDEIFPSSPPETPDKPPSA